MPENSAPRSTLISTAVLVIALAAVFFVGKSIGGDDNGDATPTAATSSTETFGVVTGGDATVSATPDQLTFTATVHNTRPTNEAAMGRTNHDVHAIIIAAKNNGVAAKDIQTRSISIRPKYDYSYRAGSGPRIVGYVSTESVKFLVRDLTKAGRTIGAVTDAAGNAVEISGASFTISNRDALIAKARTDAVTKSKAAAVALAKAAGRDVGQLEYVEEVQPQQVYGFAANDSALLYARAAAVPTAAKSVAINPGKQDVSVTVKVRWSLAH
jgi:uncharacterized protein YggE